MAEAAVEDRPPQKFYCHMCNVQFENASANFTCPHCSNGFIEELQETENNEEPADVEDWEDDEMDIHDILMASLPVMNDRRSGRTRFGDGSRSGRRYADNSRTRTVRPRTLTRLASSNLRQNNVPFENLIQDFIINLGVGMNFAGAGNMQLFLGNPGDYAWGREGLDAIVTQLLNQMDCTGPPPLSKDVIDALPTVEVNMEQIGAKLQCSVCWEDFIINESVKQLPCLHIYHEPCIRPWLELHGTCPICRQNLGNNEQQQNSDDDNNQDPNGGPSSGGNNTLNALRNLFQPTTSSSNPSSSSSSVNNSGSRPRSRSTSNNSDSMI